MKKIKKLQNGMTLLEVIVAMSIFSIGTAAVTMAFAAAVKYNSLNQRRDEELAYQQAAIQNGTTMGLELYNGHDKDMELVFKVQGGTYTDSALVELAETVTELDPTKLPKDEIKFLEKDGASCKVVSTFTGNSEYKATRSGKNDGVYDFELKDFGKGNLGSTSVSWSKDDGKYKIRFKNTSTKNIDIQVFMKDGTIYEGEYDTGYRHGSCTYTRAVAGTGSGNLEDSEGNTYVPSSFEVGYYNPNYATETDTVTIRIYMDGSIKTEMTIDNNDLANSPRGILDLSVDENGVLSATCENET